MIKILLEIFKLLNDEDIIELDIIKWSTPIPYFGNFNNSKIATLGINPSNREFTDSENNSLINNRLQTLDSLGLNNWREINDEHLQKILDTCDQYFENNPYRQWFNKLEYLLSETPYSYYFPLSNVCHLDLIPFATSKKWSNIPLKNQKNLLNKGADILGHIINESKLEYIILNGTTVISTFENISNLVLNRTLQNSWQLERINNPHVLGYSFTGTFNKIGGVELNREIKILGFNHNIQSSFGITKEVMLNIKKWTNTIIK